MALKVNGASLRAIRERSGLSLADLAKRVGIKPPHLTNVEMQRRGVSPRVLRALADELGVPLAAITQQPVDSDDLVAS